MNHISARHRSLSECLQKQDVLINPELYLGPNYKTLLNYWIFMESLKYEQVWNYNRKCVAIDFETHLGASRMATTSSKNIIGETKIYTFDSIEREIIAAHIIIDSGKTLSFIPLLENL